MSGLPSLLSFLIFFFISSALTNPSKSFTTESFIYGGCSQLKYAHGSAYESNVNAVLTSLVNSATYTSYTNFTISGSDVVYGLFQCRGDLSTSDCSNCVSQAVSQLGNLCFDSTGGALQLQGCLVKYDNTTFLGVQDKNLILKKCGPSIGFDSDVINRKDEVLDGLTSGGGFYRVSGSGRVRGVAQCVGDLSGGECQSCLMEAIGRLRNDCGTAVSGDVFLGKCYARYSTNGIDYKSHKDSSDEDSGEKALAITIGIFAIVALIIIFISFLRRSINGKGK